MNRSRKLPLERSDAGSKTPLDGRKPNHERGGRGLQTAGGGSGLQSSRPMRRHSADLTPPKFQLTIIKNRSGFEHFGDLACFIRAHPLRCVQQLDFLEAFHVALSPS
jgi:hypothetical protein